jgi:hypothetical protein
MHSWGIAIDVNPQDNRGIYFKNEDDAPAFDVDEGFRDDEWLETWPEGMPPQFVGAFQSVGFAWGADWNEDGDTTDHTYLDPMHFELRDRSKK